MQIRKAQIEDLKTLQILFVDTVEDVCSDDYSPEQIKIWTSSISNRQRWEKVIQDQYFLIVETQEVVVGFGSLEKGQMIDFMYVHKDHQRKGVAQMLYEALQAEGVRRGHQVLFSDVSKTAVPFFQKQGFLIVRENVHTIEGVSIINYRMEKRL